MTKLRSTKSMVKGGKADELKAGYGLEVRTRMKVLAAQVHGCLKVGEVNLARVLFSELAWYFSKPEHVELKRLPSDDGRAKK